jgi:hypothetical protein
MKLYTLCSGTLCSSHGIMLISSSWHRRRCSNYSVTAGQTSASVFLFCSRLILNRNSRCEDRVLLRYWKMWRSTKTDNTSRSCWGEQTSSCCTKIIKRWWTSLEVGFFVFTSYVRQALKSGMLKHCEIFVWSRIRVVQRRTAFIYSNAPTAWIRSMNVRSCVYVHVFDTSENIMAVRHIAR